MYLLYTKGLKLRGQSPSQFSSCWHKKELAKAGPKGDPIAIPSICWNNSLLNKKIEFEVASCNNFVNCFLLRLAIRVVEVVNKRSEIILMVSWTGMFVNRDLISKLVM